MNDHYCSSALTCVTPMLPTFSEDALTPELAPSRPATMALMPWTPIPRFTALAGGSDSSTSQKYYDNIMLLRVLTRNGRVSYDLRQIPLVCT